MTDSLHCPLCQQPLTTCHAVNGSALSSCWCMATGQPFPPALLDQVPTALRDKACICQRCVDAYHATLD